MKAIMITALPVALLTALLTTGCGGEYPLSVRVGDKVEVYQTDNKLGVGEVLGISGKWMHIKSLGNNAEYHLNTDHITAIMPLD